MRSGDAGKAGYSGDALRLRQAGWTNLLDSFCYTLNREATRVSLPRISCAELRLNTNLNLNSSVPFTGQRIRSLAETQRRGDSANLRWFAGRFSIHPFGEESIPSFLAPNPARFFKMPLFSGLSLRTLRSWRLCVRTKRGI